LSEEQAMIDLPLPDEPSALKALVRELVQQAPETGVPLVVAGTWLADPLWELWGTELTRHGMARERFGQIVAGFGNELRLWVVGERLWTQYITSLAGRVTRRLSPMPARVEPPVTSDEVDAAWHVALSRVGIRPDADQASLISRIGELQLHYELGVRSGTTGSAGPARGAFAIVWAGGRLRDPEVPCGEAWSSTSAAAALAQALGHFLLKDPAYPPAHLSVPEVHRLRA
jgi:hypothetical protein